MSERRITVSTWIGVGIAVLSAFLLTSSLSVDAADMSSSLSMYDSRGKPLDEVVVGQQVTFSTIILNDKDVPQPFFFILEIRDDRGFTHHFALQNSTLPAKSQVEIGASWIAEDAGKYNIRTGLQTEFGDLPPDVGIILYEYELIIFEKTPYMLEEE